MKLSFPKMLCGVVVALGTVAAGCGSKKIDLTDSNAVTAEAIAMVERAIPLEESQMLGRLPSLYMQSKAAVDSVNRVTNTDKYDSDSESDRSMREAIATAWFEGRDIVKVHYDSLLNDEVQKLAGTQIPMNFDNGDFVGGTATITNDYSDCIYVDFALEIGRGLSIWDDKGIEIQYLDENGGVISSSKSYHSVWTDTYDNNGLNVGKTLPGNYWKGTFGLSIPDLGKASALRVAYSH